MFLQHLGDLVPMSLEPPFGFACGIETIIVAAHNVAAFPNLIPSALEAHSLPNFEVADFR